MTVKVVKPIKITEAVLAASSIPEPDASVGEVVFNAESKKTKFPMEKTSVKTYGNACIFGDPISVDKKIIIPTESSNSESALPNSFYALARDIGGSKSSGVWFNTFTTSQYNSVSRASSAVISYTGISSGLDGLDDGSLYYIESEPAKLYPLNLSSAKKLSISAFLSNTTKTLCSGHVSSASFACALDYESHDGSNVFKVIQINKSTGSQEFNQTIAYPDLAYQNIASIFEYESSPAIAFSGVGGVKVYKYASGFGSNPELAYSVDFAGSLSGAQIDAYIKDEYITLGLDLTSFDIIRLPDGAGVVSNGYQPGERAILTSTHKLYQCVKETLIRPDLGATGDENETWIEVSPTNRWSIFTDAINSASIITKDSAARQREFILKPQQKFTSCAVFGCSGLKRVFFQVFTSSGVLRQSVKVDMIDYDAALEWGLDDASPAFIDSAFFDGLNYFDGDYFKLIIDAQSGFEGSVKLFAFGIDRLIGEAINESMRKNYIDLSTYENDQFGNTRITKRPVVALNTYSALVENARIDVVDRFLNSLAGEFNVWLADIGNGQKILTYGAYERAPAEINHNSYRVYTATIRSAI